MRIAVFGLGYVGVVSAACLAREGHEVCGVEPNPVKRELINAGRSPIIEPQLDELIAAAVAGGRLQATADCEAAVRGAHLILVCVGTPGQANGCLDLRYVQRACHEIGEALSTAGGGGAFPVVAIRSTMLPGSMRQAVIPALERASGGRAGEHFGVCINPEFMREGTAIHDYEHPPKTVIGADDERTGHLVRELYAQLDAPLICTDLQTAEMVKYADNAWHALKVTFANEIGRLCRAFEVDSRRLMSLFCQDTKLNISPSYLRPGFAFGGSCLPKDLRALMYRGRTADVVTPVLASILPSNQAHLEHALTLIQACGHRRVGLLGLSFKAGTDDLRESPIVTLAEQLIGKGYELAIFDRNVRLASLVGANREYILERIPHISRLLLDRPEPLFERSQTIVLATGEPEFGELCSRLAADRTVIDLVGAWNGGDRQCIESTALRSYEGISW